MTTAEKALLRFLKHRSREYKRSYREQTKRPAPEVLFEDLLLKHGHFYAPQPLPRGVRRGTSKQCFWNAFRRASGDSRFRYAEGFVICADLRIPILHGFLVDDAGAYDCTLPEPGVLYYGIEFPNLRPLLSKSGFTSISDDTQGWVNTKQAMRRFCTARSGRRARGNARSNSRQRQRVAGE
jgi:hypothetical protein